MGYKNLTIRGKTDGFGCQYNAILSGVAFCNNHPSYRYVHTPMRRVSHGWETPEKTQELNQFIGIPSGLQGKKIHVPKRYISQVFNKPAAFYNHSTRDLIRDYYYSSPKPELNPEEIVVHIRRGDISPERGGDRRRRFLPNDWYGRVIPWVADRYPSHYRIAIYSEGDMQNFASIFDGWSDDLIQRVSFYLATDWVADQKNCLQSTFNNMVNAKVLVMSKSGLSYCAGILNSNSNVYFVKSRAVGQSKPLPDWIRTIWGG
jgi:hypothetical protein